MLYVVSHKNGNVRAVVNADNADEAYVAFRAARISQGVRPKRSNHSTDLLDTPLRGAAPIFLRNTKDASDTDLD